MDLHLPSPLPPQPAQRGKYYDGSSDEEAEEEEDEESGTPEEAEEEEDEESESGTPVNDGEVSTNRFVIFT